MDKKESILSELNEVMEFIYSNSYYKSKLNGKFDGDSNDKDIESLKEDIKKVDGESKKVLENLLEEKTKNKSKMLMKKYGLLFNKTVLKKMK
jgi:hypothetical protein